VGAYLKIWPSLGATFRGNPRFRKYLTTGTDGVYIPCKFDVDIIRLRGYSPSNFGRKAKVKPVVGISQYYTWVELRRGRLSITYINLGPVGCYLTPSRAARVIFENSKIYTIFGTAAIGPYGRQPMVAQKTVSPIISAWCVKISAC